MNTKRSKVIAAISSILIVVTIITTLVLTQGYGEKNYENEADILQVNTIVNSVVGAENEKLNNETTVFSEDIVENTVESVVVNAAESKEATTEASINTKITKAPTTVAATSGSVQKKEQTNTTKAAAVPATTKPSTVSTTASPETTTQKKASIPWGTTKDLSASSVENSVNSYINSLSNCTVDKSLNKNNSCWMGSCKSYSYNSAAQLTSELKEYVDIYRRDCADNIGPNGTIAFNIKAQEIYVKDVNETYYEFYVFYICR